MAKQGAVGLVMGACVLIVGSTSIFVQTQSSPQSMYANEYDLRCGTIMAQREADWRNGAVVYQIIVDRFAPAQNLEAKRELYDKPRRLREWHEAPERGVELPEFGVWSHELDFWGGDLDSLSEKIDYLKRLGVEVVYLNPIHEALTNHKYDATDYFNVAPEYGTREDVKSLAEALHARDMRLVLDGVFNHVGRSNAWFKSAMGEPASEFRDWFLIGDQYEEGYRGWANVKNLPELNLENEAVRARIYGDRDSVVQGYLRDGVDGWRLDVAFDLGFVYLRDLTTAAHSVKPDSLVVGEVWNYPEEWMPALDGLMNFFYGEVARQMMSGMITGEHAGRMIDRCIADTGMEAMLKSWIILDNHDTDRIKYRFNEEWQQRMAQVMQFTLPGAPCVYYGVEIGMTGGHDPGSRGPFQWDQVGEDNPDYAWFTKLMRVRQESRALQIGDFRLLDSGKLLAFSRRTDRIEDLRIIVANPTRETVTDVVPCRDSKLMNWEGLYDMLADQPVDADAKAPAQVMSGTIEITCPPQRIMILRPSIDRDPLRWSPYKRIQ
jgi:glycosidase